MNLLFILLSIWHGPKEETKTITKTYDVSSQEDLIVLVNNVYGSIEVVPSSTGKVEVKLEIEIRANSDELVERGKKELMLGEYISGDTIGFYTRAPFVKDCDNPFKYGWWGGHEPAYDFTYNYTIKMPAIAGLNAKTVNNGLVKIEGIKGTIVAGNVNGGVEISKAEDLESASSVNGDVNVSFSRSPRNPIKFNTVNGNFNLDLPEDFAGKVYFDTMHGDMYSAFDYRKTTPVMEESKKGATFKIATKTGVEIGSGGPILDFRSINGNVYLKKLN